MTEISLSNVTNGACGVPPGASWWALRVASNRERSVQAALSRAGLGSFLPAYQARVEWSDRTKTVERLLFPGYIFASLELVELPAALHLGGVVSVLPSNLRPAAVTETEIENVRLALLSSLPVEPAPIAVGECVTVKRGPLRGVSGIVTKTATGFRLVVNVEMLGRALAVKLDAGDVARVN